MSGVKIDRGAKRTERSPLAVAFAIFVSFAGVVAAATVIWQARGESPRSASAAAQVSRDAAASGSEGT